MDKISLTQNIADAVWQKVRLLAKSIAQYDNFIAVGKNFMPTQSTDDAQKTTPSISTQKIANEFLLETLSQVFMPANFSILEHLSKNPEATMAEIIAKASESELQSYERFSFLLQSGFVEKNYDTGKIYLTETGHQLVEWVLESRDQLEKSIEKMLPEIMNG